MIQVLQPIGQQPSRAAGGDIAAPLCSARNRFPCRHTYNPDGLRRTQRNADAVEFSTPFADQVKTETDELSLVTGSSATRWKRVESPSNTSGGSSSLVEPSATTTTSVSSSHDNTSPPNSAQPLSTFASLSISTSSTLSTYITQTPFTSTPTETLVIPSSFASGIVSSWGLSSSSTLMDAGRSETSFVPQSTLSTGQPRPSPSFTPSDSGSITLTTVNPTSTIIDSQNKPGTTQPESDTTRAIASSISSTSFVISAPSFLSTVSISSIPSTSEFLTPTAIPHPSISVISLNSVSADNPNVAPTSTSTAITVSSVVQTGVLSTDTPRDTGFAHQTGAIIGVTFAGTFVLLLTILLIFFAYKRHRSNRSYSSSMEDINASWHPPLERDDDEHHSAVYGYAMSPNYTKPSGSQGHSERGGFFGDHLSVERGGSGSADANDDLPMKAASGGQALMFPVAQTLHGSTNSRGPLTVPSFSSNDGHGTSRPWSGNTEPKPLNINKFDSSRRLPLTIDSHVSAVGRRSANSLGLGGSSSSNGHHNPGSSGEAPLPKGHTRTISITGSRPIQRLSGRRHYSTPPTALVSGRDSSVNHGAQRMQHPEEEKKRDRVNKCISQANLARLRASRRPSTATSINAYSHCTATRSEESVPYRAPSYIYSPSLLNPPISIPQTFPRPHLPRGVPDDMLSHPHLRVGNTSEELVRPSVTLPPAPSPALTDSSSMVEGLLHPRLAQAQQDSTTSLRDHEDYTRPINGLVNNHIRSTTTFETQDTMDLGEGGS